MNYDDIQLLENLKRLLHKQVNSLTAIVFEVSKISDDHAIDTIEIQSMESIAIDQFEAMENHIQSVIDTLEDEDENDRKENMNAS